MPYLLRRRQTELLEHMDDPHCDLERLERTYSQFSVVNQLVAGWQLVYRRFLRPLMVRQPISLLDIGSGGGDVARQLAHWARRDGLELRLTLADPDGRAFRYAKSRALPPNVRLVRGHSRDLANAGERFDVVTSNHLLHHLSKAELKGLCQDSAQLARHLALHNDICRSDLAYLGFALTWPLFRKSFITADGLRSIRRSYTPAELAKVAPSAWRVETFAPYRNLLLWTP